jgi:acyl-coenzyme A synthetase/AMP-(fatty) acid ligase
MRLLDKLAAGGKRDAIVHSTGHGTRRVSCLEARSTILRFAGALSGNSVREGDGVALFVVNSPEALLLKIAVHFVGGRLVFVPPEPGNAELAAFIARADVKMLIFDPVLGKRAADLAREAEVPAVFSLGDSGDAPDFVRDASRRAELAPQDAADGSAVCTLLYSGGTTGSPKMVTHRSRFYDGVIAVAARRRASPDPRTLICTLITHVSGHIVSLAGLLAGEVVVLSLPGTGLWPAPGSRRNAPAGRQGTRRPLRAEVLLRRRRPPADHRRRDRQKGFACRLPRVFRPRWLEFVRCFYSEASHPERGEACREVVAGGGEPVHGCPGRRG